jgi:uncharacterized membrane protein YkvA (DUF1232 family)
MKKAEIDEILMPEKPEPQGEQEQKVRKNFWNKVAGVAGRVPFMEDVVASYYCALDPETPAKVRGILLAALAYFILPLDTIPDFLIGFGLTDDIAVLTAAITAIQGNIKDSHREAARKKLEN